MTRYDDVTMDPSTGLTRHPLAGVPQHVLDAAVEALREATFEFTALGNEDDEGSRVHLLCIDEADYFVDGKAVKEPDFTDVEPIAHGVLIAAIEASRAGRPTPKPKVTRADFFTIYNRDLTDEEWARVKASPGWDAVDEPQGAPERENEQDVYS